ncbi:oxidoreductase [Streptomyces sp. NPDC058221]|uniref:oxidoreductase n=1 Tax=Streptomyces sp. NPDC058221 TaxID=3346388 RepID=UPI0036E1BD3D
MPATRTLVPDVLAPTGPLCAPPSLLTTAAAWAASADRERRLHPDVVRAVTEVGFARHFVVAHGDSGAGTFTELLAAAAAVADRGCASAAWCAALWAVHGRYAAFLPEEGRHEIWADSPDVRISAGIQPSAATAVPVPDGWRVQGEWGCVSGVDVADWVLLAATDGGGAGPRVFAVPRADVVIHDTWRSSGLRGTGSNTVTVDAVSVPHHRTFPLAELLHGRRGTLRSGCCAAPAHLGGVLAFCAPALGAARRALRLWTESDPEQATGAGQETFTRTSAEIDTAHLVLEAAARRADVGPMDERSVAHNRRDAAFAADLLVTAVERLFRAAGSRAHHEDSEMQRCRRDVHTVASHAALRFSSASRTYAAQFHR